MVLFRVLTEGSTAGGGDLSPYSGGMEELHRFKTFREELIEMLRLAEVEFDPQYLD
jgi:hypothetical protein